MRVIMERSLLISLVALVAVVAAFWGAEGVAHMATSLAVTKTEDTNDGVCDADCSIREAIDAANSGDTINVPAGVYTVTTTLVIGKDLILVGALSASTIIQAAESPGIANYGVLSIDSGNAVDISNLTSSKEDEDGQVVDSALEILHGSRQGEKVVLSSDLSWAYRVLRMQAIWSGKYRIG